MPSVFKKFPSMPNFQNDNRLSDDADHFFNQGVNLQKLGKHKEAIDLYDKAISLNCNFIKCYNNKGIALGLLHRYDEAIRSFDKALLINKNYSQAYNNKGFAYECRKMYKDALEYYDKALTIDPHYKEASNNKQNVLILLEIEEERKNRKLYLNESPYKYDVFISYSCNEKGKAKHLKEMLSKYGKNCKIVRKSDDDEFEFRKMAEAIIYSKVVVLCLSISYLNSDRCFREAQFSYSHNKTVMSVLVQHKTTFPTWPPNHKLFYLLGDSLDVIDLTKSLKSTSSNEIPEFLDFVNKLDKKITNYRSQESSIVSLDRTVVSKKEDECLNKFENLITPTTNKVPTFDEIISVVDENRILVKSCRDDSQFKFEIINIIHSPNIETLTLQKWLPTYKTEELDIDLLCDLKKHSVSIINSNPHFLILIVNKSQQLHIFYKKLVDNRTTFQTAAVIPNIKDSKQKYKTSFIDQNEAYVVLYNNQSAEIKIYKFEIKNNNCSNQTFNIQDTNGILDKYFSCIFTSKSHYLVAWNDKRNVVCYIDFENEKMTSKSFGGLITNDLRAIPDTDDVIVLNNETIDYIEVQNDINCHKGIVKMNSKMNVIRIKNSFLFLFSNGSVCQIYDLANIRKKQTIEKPDFQISLEGIEDEVYLTNDSKYFFFKSVQVAGKRQKSKLHILEKTNNNELKLVEIDRSLAKVDNENFIDFIEIQNFVIMIKDNVPHVIRF